MSEQLRGKVLETQLSYWKEKLAGSPPLLDLPIDRTRPATGTYRGGHHSLTLSSSLSKSIKALSRREDAPLSMTLLAAFQSLLYRYTEQDDIVVGCPDAGRAKVGTERLTGLFVNTSVLRTDLSGNPTFRELLGRVREVASEAHAHGGLSFEKLAEELRPGGDLNRTPLFQVMFRLRNDSTEPVGVQDFGMDDFEFDGLIARPDLALDIVDKPEGLCCSLEYNADLFDASTIKRMAGHFQRLLEGITADSNQSISTLPLLTEAERRQLLVEWNDTRADYPRDLCIHQLFEAQVERTPDATAVVFEDQQLTYRELNARANQLAHYLRERGVRPDTLVGICAERSLEMVIGLLGVLKAGGAYVPLDPSYPKERLAFMLEDTHVPVLLTQYRLLEDLPRHGAHVFSLDTDWGSLAEESEDNVVSGATADNLAYVIYTSGSTGRPKGAMIPHGALVNHMLWMQRSFPLTEADPVLQKTPFSFDASVWEFYAPLLAGARLIVARPGGHQDSAYLVKLIAEHQVSTIQFVPSLLQVLLEEPGLESCKCLRQVFCGGEALPVELQERFFARLDADLVNLYGPTEACIDATFHTCQPGSTQRSTGSHDLLPSP